MKGIKDFDTMKINIVGDIFLDIVAQNVNQLPTKWSTDTLASSIQQFPGGSALNCATHASNYLEYRNVDDVKVAVFSAVGHDSFGYSCLDFLGRQQNVESNVIFKGDMRTGSCIVISGRENRSFITDRGCIDSLAVDWFPLNLLLSTNLIHVTGYYNCRGLHPGLLNLLKQAKEKCIKTCLNPQYDATGVWGGIEELCPYLDLIICNEDEIKFITSGAESDLDHCANKLFSWGCHSAVIVTLGSEGAVVYYKDFDQRISSLHQPTAKIEVVDTTGCQLLFDKFIIISILIALLLYPNVLYFKGREMHSRVHFLWNICVLKSGPKL